MMQSDSMSDLTHMSPSGDARMVDVSNKNITSRTAVARGTVCMNAQTLSKIEAREGKKGNVLSVAQLAGIMSAKRTSDLIPLCHPLPLSHVEVLLRPCQTPPRIEIEASVKTTGKTGVEMEALTAVSVTALTIYDMLKSVDRKMEITDIRLVYKEGGKSGRFEGRQ